MFLGMGPHCTTSVFFAAVRKASYRLRPASRRPARWHAQPGAALLAHAALGAAQQKQLDSEQHHWARHDSERHDLRHCWGHRDAKHYRRFSEVFGGFSGFSEVLGGSQKRPEAPRGFRLVC